MYNNDVLYSEASNMKVIIIFMTGLESILTIDQRLSGILRDF